jgi:hypothetical protein
MNCIASSSVGLLVLLFNFSKVIRK